MPRYNSGVLTGAGSTTLPIFSIYASGSVEAAVREIGVSNTTGSAVALKLVRLSTAGTPGAYVLPGKHNPSSGLPQCSTFNSHVSTATSTDLGYRCQLGAGAGYGWVWSFGDTGIRTNTGTANGLGILVENGTGQACQAYIVWDE